MNIGNIGWGKVITGAAVVAGAVAVIAMFPEQVDKVGEVVKSGLASAYDAIGDAGKWVLSKVGAMADWAAENKGLAIGGAALVGGGLIAATHHGKVREPESFTLREDARRVQALMIARMQAQGYQPAMAMNSMGR